MTKLDLMLAVDHEKNITAESRFSDCKYSEYSWFSEGITADHFITVT